MSQHEPRLSRSQLLEAMDLNWGRYLETVSTLPDAEREEYARLRGFDSFRDLLAHLCVQFERALAAVPSLEAGISLPAHLRRPGAGDPSAARDYSSQTLPQLEQDFEQLWTALAGMMGELEPGALDDPKVYNWLYNTAVEQYQQVEPPGDPQAPAAQHSRLRPEPGDHAPPQEPA
jgi:hypothetical protein